MADTGSSRSPVARPIAKIVDAARQVVQTVTPGISVRGRQRRRRTIPPTVPPKLTEARGSALRAARAVRDTAARATGATRDTAAEDDRPAAGVAYEDWTKADLYERARELDIDGRSKMSKDELIAALRSHS